VIIGWDAYILFFLRKFFPAFIRDKIVSFYLWLDRHHE
jgi:hypothetical protein